MEKLKIAIVGCGGIANQKHMPSIRANAEKARWSLSVISYRRGHKGSRRIRDARRKSLYGLQSNACRSRN